MCYIELCETVKSASEDTYTINSEARRECEEIMDKIYKENPSYWPEGLQIKGHHDLYMIREASTRKAIGFTGWQEFVKEGGKKVGYYTIGILPDYRHNGFAKEAVRKLIRKKASGVDRVEAYIAPHNRPSINLANRLGVQVVKAAMLKQVGAFAGAGALGSGFMDALAYGRDKSFEEYKQEPWTASRIANTIANFGLGGLATVKGLPAATKATMLASMPIKDLAIAATPEVGRISESLHTMASKPGEQSWLEKLSPDQKSMLMGVGGIGAAGLLYGGYKGIKSLNNLADANKSLSGGRMRVTLPSKDKYDHETVVDMPLSDVNVSNNQKQKLIRDVRRRIYRETKERTRRQRNTEDTNNLENKSASVLLPADKTSLSVVSDLLKYIHHVK